jgi:vacuolar-type H+-ATPase subunit D/Vma8
MSEFDELIAELKQKRDELRVKIHLASKEAQDEWQELESKMREFSEKAELGKTGEGLGDAFGNLGQEIKAGYQRVREALKNDD